MQYVEMLLFVYWQLTHKGSAILIYENKKAAEEVLSQHCHQIRDKLIHVCRSHTYSQAAQQQNSGKPQEELEQLWLKLKQKDGVRNCQNSFWICHFTIILFWVLYLGELIYFTFS